MIKKLFILLMISLSVISCTDDIIDNEKTEITPIDNILDGEYAVLKKEIIKDNGDTLLFYPMGSTNIDNITGWMSETKLIFTEDSLGIFQLVDQGWSEGYVILKWNNGLPIQVGCRLVESVSETHISWYQEDVIIKNYLEKLQ
jgi:hypothetical protein